MRVALLGKRIVRDAHTRLRRVYYRGQRRTCVVCGFRARKFLDRKPGDAGLNALGVVGGGVRADDVCPVCFADERVRLIWTYVEKESRVWSTGGRVLHVTPEWGLLQRLQGREGIDYVPAGPSPEPYRGFVQMDLERLPFAADSFDFIICNDVLERVPDDRVVIRELVRVLKPGGAAILQVSVATRLLETREDSTVTSPEDRVRWYGRSDRVRLYGVDYQMRLQAFGLNVEQYDVFDRMSDLATERRVNAFEKLFVVSKPCREPLTSCCMATED